MKQTRWLTEAKTIADRQVADGLVYYIMPTGDYTEFEKLDKGYMVVSVAEIKTLAAVDIESGNSTEDYIYDECLYATDDSVEPNLEPEREEIEHYLDDYFTDDYQRNMPTGNSTIGLLFYAKVSPSWNGLVEDLLDQIRERELAESNSGSYEWAIKEAIEERINDIYWEGINWAYECWAEQVQEDYPWIKNVGRVRRSDGHIKIISSWPETTDELAEIAQDCAKIKRGIDAEIKWLESEQHRLTEYRAAFNMYEIETMAKVA